MAKSIRQYGTVYTVRASEFIDDEQYIWLAEIESAPRQYSDEFGERELLAEDFRPVTLPSKKSLSQLERQ